MTQKYEVASGSGRACSVAPDCVVQSCAHFFTSPSIPLAVMEPMRKVFECGCQLVNEVLSKVGYLPEFTGKSPPTIAGGFESSPVVEQHAVVNHVVGQLLGIHDAKVGES
jgi:hypothetical protein